MPPQFNGCWTAHAFTSGSMCFCLNADNEATLHWRNRPAGRFQALFVCLPASSSRFSKAFACAAKCQTRLSNGQVVSRLAALTPFMPSEAHGSIRPCPPPGQDGQTFLSWVQTAAGGGRRRWRAAGLRMSASLLGNSLPGTLSESSFELGGSASPSDVKRNKFRQTLPGGCVDSRTLSTQGGN